MNPPKIVSLGEALWDIYPDRSVFGGAPANFAVHSSNLGAHVTMATAVGDDELGREAVDELRRYSVKTDCVLIDADAPTGTVRVTLNEAGKPRYEIVTPAAWDQIQWTELLAERVASSDFVYFGTLGQRGKRSKETIRQAIELAKANDVPRLVDINLREPFFDHERIVTSLEMASILKLSDDELAIVCDACGMEPTGPAETIIEQLRVQQGLDTVLMTLGSDGAVLTTGDQHDNQCVRHPGIPTEVIDTVGAGDSFTAAFLVSMHQKLPLKHCLESACQTASKVCRSHGAMPPANS